MMESRWPRCALKALAFVATAILAVLAVGSAAAVTLPQEALDHWADEAAAHFPNPETGSQEKDVSGHPTAGTNDVPLGPVTWLDPEAPYGTPAWLSDEGARGPPTWVQ